MARTLYSFTSSGDSSQTVVYGWNLTGSPTNDATAVFTPSESGNYELRGALKVSNDFDGWMTVKLRQSNTVIESWVIKVHDNVGSGDLRNELIPLHIMCPDLVGGTSYNIQCLLNASSTVHKFLDSSRARLVATKLNTNI